MFRVLGFEHRLKTWRNVLYYANVYSHYNENAEALVDYVERYVILVYHGPITDILHEIFEEV